jgi:hypothetical protein
VGTHRGARRQGFAHRAAEVPVLRAGGAEKLISQKIEGIEGDSERGPFSIALFWKFSRVIDYLIPLRETQNHQPQLLHPRYICWAYAHCALTHTLKDSFLHRSFTHEVPYNRGFGVPAGRV